MTTALGPNTPVVAAALPLWVVAATVPLWWDRLPLDWLVQTRMEMSPFAASLLAWSAFLAAITLAFALVNRRHLALLRRERAARVQAEDAAMALRASEQSYRSAVAQVQEVIFQLDTQGRWTFLNPAWTTLTGYDVAGSLGRPFLDVVVPEAREHDAARFQALVGQTADFEHLEVQILTADGRARWVEVVARATVASNGSVIGTTGTLRDITERRRADAQQAELAQAQMAQVQAEAAVHRLGFLADATRHLTSSLDYDTRVARVARLAVPTLADCCLVYLLGEDEGLHLGALACGDSELEGPVQRLVDAYPTSYPALDVLRTGHPRLLDTIPSEVLEPLLSDPALRDLVRSTALTAGVVLPLRTPVRPLGLVVLLWRTVPGDTATTVAVAEALVEQAAVVIDNARLHAEVSRQRARLQDLVGRLLSAQEHERRQVAYDIHDGLAQLAAGVQMHLDAFASHYRPRSARSARQLDRTLALAQQTVQEARRLVAGLRPTVLDDFGLASAVRLEVDALGRDGWETTFEDGVGPVRFPTSVETVCFRIAQEALRNVRKHAGLGPVRVTLRRGSGLLRLTVEDHGHGFDADRRTSGERLGEHIGLAGMQERASLVGGHCAVRSQPGAGTLVTAEIPLAHPGVADEPPAYQAAA